MAANGEVIIEDEVKLAIFIAQLVREGVIFEAFPYDYKYKVLFTGGF